MSIRFVTVADAEQIANIYNYYVENSICTFDVEPVSTAYFEEKIRNNQDYPWLVYEKENKILGYIYLSRYKDREAYGKTSELSIYVDKNNICKGIGSKLMESVLIEAKNFNINNVISVLALPNSESFCLHRQFGFVRSGVLTKVGKKLGRSIDVMLFQLIIDCDNVDNKFNYAKSPIAPLSL